MPSLVMPRQTGKGQPDTTSGVDHDRDRFVLRRDHDHESRPLGSKRSQSDLISDALYNHLSRYTSTL